MNFLWKIHQASMCQTCTGLSCLSHHSFCQNKHVCKTSFSDHFFYTTTLQCPVFQVPCYRLPTWSILTYLRWRDGYIWTLCCTSGNRLCLTVKSHNSNVCNCRLTLWCTAGCREPVKLSVRRECEKWDFFSLNAIVLLSSLLGLSYILQCSLACNQCVIYFCSGMIQYWGPTSHRSQHSVFSCNPSSLRCTVFLHEKVYSH